MLRTLQFACTLPKHEADALNAESGRIYTDMLVRHYRLYRKQGLWLAPKSGERLEDALGGPTTLHAHSRDAAQQGFYKACKTARACGTLGWTPRSLQAQALADHDLEGAQGHTAPHGGTAAEPGSWVGSHTDRVAYQVAFSGSRGVP